MVYLFHYSNCSHPSFEVGYLFLSKSEWQISILWRILCLFWWKIFQSSIAWEILSAVVCLFKKTVGFSYAFFQKYHNYFYRILAAIHPFNGTAHFSDVKICNHPALPTHFPLEHRSHRETNFTHYIFRAASIILKWQQPLQAATFS